MYLYDTNIFLEILLDQDRSDSAIQALRLMSEDKPGWVTAFSIHAIEAILASANKNECTVDFLTAIVEHPYLSRYDTSSEEELAIAQSIPRVRLDFDDSLQLYVAKKLELSLVTFDAHFRGRKDVEVIFPA